MLITEFCYEFQVSEVSIRKRELTYQMVKMNKILSRITGKTEEQVGHPYPMALFLLLLHMAHSSQKYKVPIV